MESEKSKRGRAKMRVAQHYKKIQAHPLPPPTNLCASWSGWYVSVVFPDGFGRFDQHGAEYRLFWNKTLRTFKEKRKLLAPVLTCR